MEPLEQLGSLAYQKGLWGDYSGAIAILSKAIARFPYDRRLYNNRCYYYYKSKDYKNAYLDAENMLQLFPSYARGYFRKGEILMDFKKYAEAEQVFRNVLKLDPGNEEASFNLLEAQICQLTEGGGGGKFLLTDVITALKLNCSNTEQAKAFLTMGWLGHSHKVHFSNIYHSDEEDENPPKLTSIPVFSPRFVKNRSATPGKNRSVTSRPKAGGSSVPRSRSVSNPRPANLKGSGASVNDPYTDPNNPFNANALWIGNITKKITEEKLKSVFSKYGKIKSIIIQHRNHCAFVNYMQSSMATAAMRNFTQKYPLEDTFLVIRFPDSAKVKNCNKY